MNTWNTFRIVSLIWGLMAIITKPILFTFFGQKWRDWLLGKAYTDGQRPRWISAAAVLSAALIGFVWWRVAVEAVSFSWILAALMTLSAIKILTLIFNYGKFQSWVKELLKDRRKENQMVAAVTLAGAGLIAIAFLVY